MGTHNTKKEGQTAKKKDKDIEKGYTTKQMVAKLRRLADCLENGKQLSFVPPIFILLSIADLSDAQPICGVPTTIPLLMGAFMYA